MLIQTPQIGTIKNAVKITDNFEKYGYFLEKELLIVFVVLFTSKCLSHF